MSNYSTEELEAKVRQHLTPEQERKILDHYKIKTLFPTEWPPERDFSDDDEDSKPTEPRPAPLRERRKSRFYELERSASNRISVPGAERSKDGVESFVQADEPDPLGVYSSIVTVLRERGIRVDDSIALRNRYLLSSTTFDPKEYLYAIHGDADAETLKRGLEHLERSIEQKSASLKILVESNFERFVRAKATIDNVYANMRDQGKENEPVQPSRGPHSRHASRASRGTSGAFSPSIGLVKSPVVSEKKKNALLKESEYGVLGVKAPLSEAAVKAEEVFGPALRGNPRVKALKDVLTALQKHRGMFQVGESIREAIKRKDYDTVVEEYAKAQRWADEARAISNNAKATGSKVSEDEAHQIIVTARMWAGVDDLIEAFKRDVWKKLAGTHFTKQVATSEDDTPEEHMTLIKVLLELGVEDNPVWVWLASRYDYLKNKIISSTERSKVELEILRRKLANGDRPSAKAVAEHLRAASIQKRPGATKKLDSAKVLEFWDHLHDSMNALLSLQGGILGEVIEFWETASSFIDGRAASQLPVGIDGRSKEHHRLSSDGIRDLRGGALELVNLIREHILTFFTEPPVEDISLLFSPIPPTPETPRTPASASLLTPRSASRFKFDPDDLPPPSPRRGDSWEQYAFWPPTANALSGAHFLSKILVLIGIAAGEMASLSVVRDSPEGAEQMKALVGAVRENVLRAVCGVWNGDAENYKLLEDWTRLREKREHTLLPNRFMALEEFILTNLQKILYISEAANKNGIVVPPSQKLIANVRSQFMASFYKTFSGMVEIAEDIRKMGNALVPDESDITRPYAAAKSNFALIQIDWSKKDYRILFTLSNLQSLQNEIVPQLISQFETNFSVALTDEVAQIRDVLGQIDARLFQSYTKPIVQDLANTINTGITSPGWGPGSPTLTNASPFVHAVLLRLVTVHSDVSVISLPLTNMILQHLLEQVSLCLIEGFKMRSSYDLPLLMQATLDVEFIAQTLAAYTTDRASETQSAIYLVLDERTDNDARQKLQGELPALKSVLKKLKEKTRFEFLCFKRQRH